MTEAKEKYLKKRVQENKKILLNRNEESEFHEPKFFKKGYDATQIIITSRDLGNG